MSNSPYTDEKLQGYDWCAGHEPLPPIHMLKAMVHYSKQFKSRSNELKRGEGFNG